MLNHFTKSVHSKQKHKPISHSKYSSVDFSVTNLITGNKHIKGRNMLYRINSPTHAITSNSNNNNNKHNTSSVSSEKQHHTLNHSTKGGCNSGNKTQLQLTRYFKGKNVDLTYGNIEPTSLIHKFYYLTDKTHHKTSKKPRQNQIYHNNNNNNNSNCKGYNNNNNMKTESSSISTTSIKPIIANFVSLRNCISMKKNCVKSRNNHNMNLNMKHLLHAQTTHTNYPKKMNVATTTTTNTNTTTTATIHVSDPHKLQSHTFHKFSKYKSFQSISASQTNNNSSNSNVKRNSCKQHDLTTTNTQLNVNNITFNSNANTISHNNITTPPSPSLEAIQNEIDRAMKSQSSKSKTKKYTILKRALESILEHCSLNHYDTALITLLERIISITQHIYMKFTSEISHLKESNDEYIKRIERITNENEEKQQNLIMVYSTEIQNLKKKIEILNNHTTVSERSSCDKDKLIIQTTQNNSKIASINKENLSDLDALYFFDKVQMCNIDKCNSNTIIPTLPLALSRNVSGVDSENNNNNIIVYSCDGIHSDNNNNSNSSNIKLKHKKNIEVVNVEYLNSNM